MHFFFFQDFLKLSRQILAGHQFSGPSVSWRKLAHGSSSHVLISGQYALMTTQIKMQTTMAKPKVKVKVKDRVLKREKYQLGQY